MAELETRNATFRLTPLAFEYTGEEWIRSELSLRMVVDRQKLLVAPQPTPTISLHSYHRFLKGAQCFLDSSALERLDLLEETEPFVFVPTEIDFEFAILDVDLSPDGDGEITCRVMLRIDRASPTYMGCTMPVEASQFSHFLKTLERELEQVVRQQSASLLVAAEV